MSHIILLNLLCALAGFGQANSQSGWRVFSPPDKSFSVELPGKPKFRRKKMTPEEDAIFKRTTLGDTHSIKIRTDPESVVSIGIFYLSTQISDQEFDKRVNLFILVAGADKEDSDFESKSDVVINGFHGREYVYHKDPSGRALFINAGKRVYFLFLETETKSEATSETINRIFKTFQLRH